MPLEKNDIKIGNTKIEHAVKHQLEINHWQQHELVDKNRKILKCLTEVVCLLRQHGLGFRGHDETEFLHKGKLSGFIKFNSNSNMINV